MPSDIELFLDKWMDQFARNLNETCRVATLNGMGVLIMWHKNGDITMEQHDKVPVGQIYEARNWNQ